MDELVNVKDDADAQSRLTAMLGWRRERLLNGVAELLSEYEFRCGLINDVGCNIEFFDKTSFSYNGEKMTHNVKVRGAALLQRPSSPPG